MKSFLRGINIGLLLVFWTGKDMVKDLHPEKSILRWLLSKILLTIWMTVNIALVPFNYIILICQAIIRGKERTAQRILDDLDHTTNKLAKSEMPDKMASDRDEVLDYVADSIKH